MKKYLTGTVLTITFFSLTSFGPEDSSGKFIGTETILRTFSSYNGQGERGIQSKTETFYLFGIASTSTSWVDCEVSINSQSPSFGID